MIRVVGFCGVAIVIAVLAGPAGAVSYRLGDVTVVTDADADPTVGLSASELRAYVYRLSGKYPPLSHLLPKEGAAIVLKTGGGPEVPSGGAAPEQGFALYAKDGHQIVHGASPRSTLWAAYHLIETWGAGFYLGSDSIPPTDPDRQVEQVTQRHEPALVIRGNLPWFNFLNSPTTWNPQDYKTFFAQMAKQKANFIGFHAYDHEPFGGYDIELKQVTMGGPLMTTISPERWWSPHIMTTKDFLFGTDEFFNRGEWGCEVGIESAWNFAPGRTSQWQQKMMADALAYARKLGIHPCLGWEVSGNPDDPQIQEAFRKRLKHTLETYPLDYFWIWQAEGRGTAGDTRNRVAGPANKDIAVDDEIKEAFAYLGPDHDLMEAARIARYVKLAHDMLRELAPEVELIVSGWGGDEHMKFSSLYVGLDKVVPDDVIFAALDNIDPRLAPTVSAAYGQVKPTRRRWPIPWFESDAGHTRVDQTGPQTNVTAFEPLLNDIVAKGCQGALGIHWRTRNVEDVAGYLYRFAWEPGLTAAEYFKRYAEDCYLADDAEKMAGVHLRLEAFGPQYVGAVGTVECASNSFWWFWQGWQKRILEDSPNRADSNPNPERFPELESISAYAKAASKRASLAGHRDAAVYYHDLAHTIDWLVKRARVGMAIWGDKAPLEQRLTQAEEVYDKGNRREARALADGILTELEAMDLRGAFQSLASTCRTRGELGMLATANARYGRYYATFVERLARILERPVHPAGGPAGWDGPETLIVYPVPDVIAPDDHVCFDAVLLPAERDMEFAIVLEDLVKPKSAAVTFRLPCIGGAYHRAVWHPDRQGAWQWRLEPTKPYARPEGSIPLAKGVVTVLD